MAKREGPQRPPAAASQGEMMGVGLQFAAAILLFLFLGRWLDARLGTAPWLLVVGMLVGAVLGFVSMYRTLVIKPRERQERERERQP